MANDTVIPFGERLRRHRQRAGMSRPVLGGLVGRSSEWVKALETGRLLTPRLPLLLRLAEVLGIADLAELTGDQRLSAATYTKNAHEQLPEVAKALAVYTIASNDGPADVAGLEARVRQLWELWHGARRHRTAVAGLLPTVLFDARITVRQAEGNDRRRALAAQAQVYHLTQLFLSFQPVPELVALTSDRAMTAAQDADNPVAMAAAGWYANHRFRDAGEQQEARTQLAMDTAQLLDPERSTDERALSGLLHLAVALSYAKVGHEGDAWRYWDNADQAARGLGDGYVHPWLMFGRGMVDAYAVTMLADLAHGGAAARQADRLDLDTIPSATRRSFHMIETARAYHQRREYVACIHLLRRAYTEAPDTSRFNIFTRSATLDLVEHGGSTVRHDARELAHDLGMAV
ncbi:MAG TPA: helix-turn-helix transcriptional regulator [Pseudonocardiaceae bacterium]|nr:helix-turn-helix transcriptional regulator [Pseudonocardiaceae bacterium]